MANASHLLSLTVHSNFQVLYHLLILAYGAINIA